MSDLVQRVWAATYTIQADHMPIDKFKVKVHPVKRTEALRDMPAFHVVTANGEETVFGLPVVTDPALDPDAVVLFYEVEA